MSLAVFDLLKSAGARAKDSQGGFNLHLIALRIPIAELGGDQQIVGVYATTSRQKVTVLRDDDADGSKKQTIAPFVGAGRAPGQPAL